MAWSPPEGSSELSSSSSPVLLEEPLCCLCLKIIQYFGFWIEGRPWEGLTPSRGWKHRGIVTITDPRLGWKGP